MDQGNEHVESNSRGACHGRKRHYGMRRWMMVTATTFWAAFDVANASSVASVSAHPRDAHWPEFRVFVAQAPTDSAIQRQLLEQKVALLANYLGSAMTKRVADGNNTAAKALVRSAEDLFEQARIAIDAGNHARADQDLDEALRNLTSVSQLTAQERRVVSDTQARTRYERFRRHIDSYLKPSSKMAGGTSAETRWQKAAARVAALTGDAEQLAAAGRHRDANKRLAEA